jgi:hypothetical protein
MSQSNYSLHSLMRSDLAAIILGDSDSYTRQQGTSLWGWRKSGAYIFANRAQHAEPAAAVFLHKPQLEEGTEGAVEVV